MTTEHKQTTLRRLRRHFITGLLTILPLWLVWVVFKFVFGLLSDASEPWVEPILRGVALSYPTVLGWLDTPLVMTIVATSGTIALLIAVGVFARRVAGRRSLAWFESKVEQIPLVNTVYGSARKLLDLLQTKPGTTQRVVLIDFPHKEMKSVGLVTRTLRETGTGRELAAVYVPTTPNPTSGYLELVPVELLTPTDWTVDEAMAFVISGGAVSRPEVPFSRVQKTSQAQESEVSSTE
ncbi:MAG: DUF502 domain-containing protein [Rhodothermales bacterium]|nr:DUF502 domain-containing protein [Rhodothermales bacterium]